MIIHKDMMLGCSLGCTLIELDHPLVLTVHEIYLYACHSPFLKCIKHGGVILHCEPCKPKYNPHILGLGIVNEFMQINFGIGREGIAGRLGPSFIHEDVLQTIGGSKVNEILISLDVQSTLEVYIRSVRDASIPPFPCGLTRTYP